MLLGLLRDLLCHFRSLVCVLLRERVVTDAIDLLVTVAVITQLLLKAAHRVARVRGVITVLYHECAVPGHRHLHACILVHAQRLAVVGERRLHLRVPLADFCIVGLPREQALRFTDLRFALIDLPRERERLLLALGIVRVRAPGCHARHIPALPFNAGNLISPRVDLLFQLVHRPVIHLVLVQPVIFRLGPRRVLELRERRIHVRAGLALVFLRVGIRHVEVVLVLELVLEIEHGIDRAAHCAHIAVGIHAIQPKLSKRHHIPVIIRLKLFSALCIPICALSAADLLQQIAALLLIPRKRILLVSLQQRTRLAALRCKVVVDFFALNRHVLSSVSVRQAVRNIHFIRRLFGNLAFLLPFVDERAEATFRHSTIRLAVKLRPPFFVFCQRRVIFQVGNVLRSTGQTARSSRIFPHFGIRLWCLRWRDPAPASSASAARPPTLI